MDNLKPRNVLLLEAFQAFLAEGLSPAEALTMTGADSAQETGAEQTLTLMRIADALEKIARLTDPVVAGEFLAFLRASDVKRAENKADRADTAAKRTFEETFGLVVPDPLEPREGPYGNPNWGTHNPNLGECVQFGGEDHPERDMDAPEDHPGCQHQDPEEPF